MGKDRFSGLLAFTSVFQVVCGIAAFAGLLVILGHFGTDWTRSTPFGANADAVASMDLIARMASGGMLILFGLMGIVFSGGINVLVAIHQNTLPGAAETAAANAPRAANAHADRLSTGIAIAMLCIAGLSTWLSLSALATYGARAFSTAMAVLFLTNVLVAAAGAALLLSAQIRVLWTAAILCGCKAALALYSFIQALALLSRFRDAHLDFTFYAVVFGWGLTPLSLIFFPVAAFLLARSANARSAEGMASRGGAVA
jgi:hypothetical protein